MHYGKYPAHPDGKPGRFEQFTTKSIELDPSGDFRTADGRALRLAGIRMRPVTDTQEPDAVAGVNRYLRRVWWPLEIQVREGSHEAVVFYQQRYRLADDYTGLINLFGPFYRRMSLNGVLIALGLANFDDGAAGLTMTDAAGLRSVHEEYRREITDYADIAVKRRKTTEGVASAPVPGVEEFCWDGRVYRSHLNRLAIRPPPGDRVRVVEEMNRIKSDSKY